MQPPADSLSKNVPGQASPVPTAAVDGTQVTRLADISSTQWKSGIAAWLGWLFDGLDMHLYTLVATSFVADLSGFADLQSLTKAQGELVGHRTAWIQAAFLVGWALGGGFFGRVGDRIGRSRALVLTILTYACFTGLSFFAQTWWHLLIFRFLAALGIGGEWAVGASLLSETWPRNWRPWIAAVLQTAVNCGVLLAAVAGFVLAGFSDRTVFLVGIAPALIVLWIRKAVPEPAEWHAARAEQGTSMPGIADLFRGSVRRVTVLTIIVCACSLTAHWAFTFWAPQHVKSLAEVADWSPAEKKQLGSVTLGVLMISSIVGNFIAALLAKRVGYRVSIAVMCVAYFGLMVFTYAIPRSHTEIVWCMAGLGAASGLFGLFTMFLPPLFPVLLRTTGAGFSYNIGRIAAAAGTLSFGLFFPVADYRIALIFAATLFLPAGIVVLFMPEKGEEEAG